MVFESDIVRRRIGLAAWVLPWVGLVLGQVHALARHQTVDGKGDLASPLTRAWSDPGRRALRPLLDWADPDTVYLTWGKLWIFVFGALLLCALVVRRQRQPHGFEKWAWRVALTGYALGTLGVVLDYGLNWTAYASWFDPAFLVVGIPGMLLTLLGSTTLGIALLRNGMHPRSACWLLALVIPAAVVLLQVTSMGSVVLPIAFAFGILGRRISRGEALPSAPAGRRGTTTVANATVAGAQG